MLTAIVFTLIDMSIGTYRWEAQEGLLSVLFKLATLIPGLTLGARRLHDINKSAWWLLIWLILWLIIQMIVCSYRLLGKEITERTNIALTRGNRPHLGPNYRWFGGYDLT